MSDCVFVTYRDSLKFEDFHLNHPATYLSLVAYNWLALAILPKIYSNEEWVVENSRKELLQKQNHLLDVLTLVINCVLGIKIKLNDDLYRQNVQHLRGVTNLSKDIILPFITIENYMSVEDSKLFIDKISKFFPAGSIKKSTDAVPCSKLYEIVNGITAWGGSYWVVIHFVTLVIDKMKKSKLKEEYRELMCGLTGFIDLLLPCSICRYHYTSLFKFSEEEDFVRPFQLTLPFESMIYARNNQLFEFYSILHDNCKPMDTRERLGVEYYKRQYEKFYKISFKNKQVNKLKRLL